MITANEHVGWRLWLKCVLVYSGSWAAGLLLNTWLGLTFGYAVSRRFENVDPAQIRAMEPFLTLAVCIFFGGALGATIGLVQSIFFYRYVGAGGWVFASALGGALSMLIGYALSDMHLFTSTTVQGNWGMGLLLSRTAFGAAQQASVGLLQWFVLRRRVYWAWEWIPACWLGGTAAGAVGLAVDNVHLQLYGAPFITVIFISPLVGGLIAGSALAWLFRHPNPSALEGLVEAKLQL